MLTNGEWIIVTADEYVEVVSFNFILGPTVPNVICDITPIPEAIDLTSLD
jgi:hypothetical protein